MNWIIPMLGEGERFLGYSRRKPFVMVNGVPMIELVVSPINDGINKIWIFCQQRDHATLKKIFNDKNIVITPMPKTSGAGETIYNACSYIPNEQFTTIDCDTIINEVAKRVIETSKGNNVFTFFENNKEGIYSYIMPDNDLMVDIKEKSAISNIASSGIYQFVDTTSYIENYLKTNEHHNGEIYISNVIRTFLSNDYQFKWVDITDNFDCVGTPGQLKQYSLKTSYKKTFVIDLDKTLVYDINKNPAGVEDNINFINSLYDFGHYIIIHTSRGMLTFSGDIKTIETTYRNKVELSLKQLGVKYNKLIFGKPFADVYIDDKSINSVHDLEQETGFYVNKNETRAFNRIKDNGEFIIKNGDSVINEIYYYKNIPKDISNLFPKVYYHPTGLKIERVNGKTYSDLILNRKLSANDIDAILYSFNSLHKYTDYSVSDIEHSNYWYSGKLFERYQKNYHFYKSINLVNEIEWLLSLNIVAKKMSSIHGDPVFTNIIKVNDASIKYIDPRGFNGTHQTIYGPTCYDYVKVLQSLYGYDFALNNTDIPSGYVSSIRDYYLSSTKDVDDIIKKLKIVFISMMPLHSENIARVKSFLELYKTII